MAKKKRRPLNVAPIGRKPEAMLGKFEAILKDLNPMIIA